MISLGKSKTIRDIKLQSVMNSRHWRTRSPWPPYFYSNSLNEFMWSSSRAADWVSKCNCKLYPKDMRLKKMVEIFCLLQKLLLFHDTKQHWKYIHHRPKTRQCLSHSLHSVAWLLLHVLLNIFCPSGGFQAFLIKQNWSKLKANAFLVGNCCLVLYNFLHSWEELKSVSLNFNQLKLHFMLLDQRKQ